MWRVGADGFRTVEVAPPDIKHDRRAHEAATRFVALLEADRRLVGMKPADMYQIAESSGIDELRAELDRRLKTRTYTQPPKQALKQPPRPTPGADPTKRALAAGNSGRSEAGQRGFHQPMKLPRLDRYRAVVRSACFQRVEPLLRFGNPRDHDKGQRGPGFPYTLQQRHIAGWFAARKHYIRIQKVSY